MHEFALGFGFGLLSSLHCLQMCGPIVLCYSVPLERAGASAWRAHLAYNIGRTLTYTALGALAGALGGAVDWLGGLAGFGRAATLLAGVLMVVGGLFLLGWGPRASAWMQVSAFFSKTVGGVMRSVQPGSKIGLGLLMGFLPCGLLYAALLQAAGTSSARSGAVVMLGFGLGTTGALLGTGMFSSALSALLGPRSKTLAGASVILAGAFLIWRGVMAMTPHAGMMHHGRS